MDTRDRQERRQARVRGAGTREITNAAFGFTFGAPPAPLQPRRSSRQTPQSALPPQRSTRKTPQPSKAELSARKTPTTILRRSTRSASANPPGSTRTTRSSSRVGSTPSSASEDSLVTPVPTKKRKRKGPKNVDVDDIGTHRLTNIGEEVTEEPQNYVPALPTSFALLQSNNPVIENDELEGLSKLADNLVDGSTRKSLAEARAHIPTDVLPETSADKPSTPETDVASLEQDELVGNTRAVITQSNKSLSSSRRIERSSTKKTNVVNFPTSVLAIHGLGITATQNSEGYRHSIGDKTNEIIPDPGVEQEEIDELSPIQERVTRNKQLQNKTKRPNLSKTDEIRDPAKDIRAQDDISKPNMHQNPGQAPRAARLPLLESKTQNKILRAGEDAVKGLKSQAKPKSTSAKPASTKIRVTTRPTSHEAKEREPKRRKSKHDSVPITVWRTYDPSKHSKIEQGGDEVASNADSDELQHDPYVLQKRLPAVNPVDILTQITSELIANQADRLRNQLQTLALPAQRAENKRKHATVEAFAAELEDRLFEITEAVDAGETLKNRAKDAVKAKARLRDELLEVKRKREEIAIKMDAVRKNRAEKMSAWSERDQVNESMWDLEMALKRGMAKAIADDRNEEGLSATEVLLSDLIEKVGSIGASKGLLERTRAFNSRLEITADIVEGRI